MLPDIGPVAVIALCFVSIHSIVLFLKGMESVHFKMRPNNGGRVAVLFPTLWELYELIWIIYPMVGVGGEAQLTKGE